MKTPRVYRILLWTCYLFMGSVIFWQVFRMVPYIRYGARQSDIDWYNVEVHGNVGQPGVYRVPEGTTQFELLKVVGLRPTSNLMGFDLSRQINADQEVSVGTLDKSVELTEEAATARLEFFFGEIGVLSREGLSRPAQEGITLREGDRVLTEARSQAEVSVNTFSHIDMDAFSEIVVDKLGLLDGTRKGVEIFHRSGVCWYKMQYAKQTDLYRIVTPLAVISVGGTGADFMIDVQFDQVTIHNFDGLLLIERLDNDEAINLISGQSAVVFPDNRPFQVSPLPGDLSPNEQFSELVKEKTNFMMRHMPLNLLFCGIPTTFYFISVQFESGVVHTVHCPRHTSVDLFVQGVSTLEQAFLHGGPIFASTLLERIMNTKIPKFIVLEKQDIVRIAAIVGNINIQVDEQAASALNMRTGRRNLSSRQIAQFIQPSISGISDSRTRQLQVMKSIFEELRSKGLVLTPVLSTQILNGLETNVTGQEIMKQYTKFTTRKEWSFQSHNLPIQKIQRGSKVFLEPDFEKCRSLLFK